MDIIKEIIIGDKKIPKIKPGDIVRVFFGNKEKEGKASIFEGMIIAIDGGRKPEATFTVRRVTFGIGVERIFPLYSPLIQKIEVKKSTKVKQAKLYYLREKFGKKFKLKEKDIDKDVLELMAISDKDEKDIKASLEKGEEAKKEGEKKEKNGSKKHNDKKEEKTEAKGTEAKTDKKTADSKTKS
jgi:large subunit ribosomal protein L19